MSKPIKSITLKKGYKFPAYCVQKIANPTPKTITINGKEFVSTPELEAMLLTLEVK